MKSSPVPVLVGVSQFTQRKDAHPALDPLGLMVKVCHDALADAGSHGLREFLDTVCVVNSFSRDDENTPARLAHILGIKPRYAIYSLIGGNTPQMLVNRFARDIASGRKKAVLITGAESIYALYRASRGKTSLAWQDNTTYGQLRDHNLPATFDTLLRLGCDHEKQILHSQGNSYDEPNNPVEEAYDLFMPQYMYPFFETAIRHVSGHSPDEHRRYMGRLCERLCCIASQNPCGWTRHSWTAEEIIQPTPQNRFVVFPYTVRMVANINVDQAAAVIMTSDRQADTLGIQRSRRVYPMGGAELNNIWHVSRRPLLHDSPAITEASRLALNQAGLDLQDIGVFDLYSCFPSAVEIARRAIGIPENDPRDLTVTGGLAYFGGPGNNYTMHAIVSAIDRIRLNPGLKAMVTANGWYNSKHAVGIYGAAPPSHPWDDRDDSSIQKAIDARSLPEPVERAEGLLTIEAYSMRYDMDGRPVRATVIGRMANGRRGLANIEANASMLRRLEQTDPVGKTGQVHFDPLLGHNRLVLTI